MITLRVQEVAQKRGIFTIKSLAETCNLAYDTASDLWHGRMKRLDLEVLNRVCMALDCVPTDLVQFSKDDSTPENWMALRATA
jgi:putative transcriptional regulator